MSTKLLVKVIVLIDCNLGELYYGWGTDTSSKVINLTLRKITRSLNSNKHLSNIYMFKEIFFNKNGYYGLRRF